MALSAKWHVHILTSNHVCVVFAGCAESETRILFAQLADSGQFLDLLALRDEGENTWERTSEEGSLQAGDHDNLAMVGSLLSKLDYIGEELALVNSDHVVGHPLVAELSECIDGCGWLLLTRMSANLEISTISEIGRKLDSEDLLASDVVLVAAAQKFSGFTREHTAHDELDATTLLHLNLRLIVDLLGRLVALGSSDLVHNIGRSLLAWFRGSDCRSLEFLLLI